MLTKELSIEEVRDMIQNDYYKDSETKRDMSINKIYSNYRTVGNVIFALVGSPPKGVAVFYLRNGTLTILDISGEVRHTYSNVYIEGLQELPDECILDENSKIIDVKKNNNLDSVCCFSHATTKEDAEIYYQQHVDNNLASIKTKEITLKKGGYQTGCKLMITQGVVENRYYLKFEITGDFRMNEDLFQEFKKYWEEYYKSIETKKDVFYNNFYSVLYNGSFHIGPLKKDDMKRLEKGSKKFFLQTERLHWE